MAYVAAYSCNGGQRTEKFARRLIGQAARVADDPFSAAMVAAARTLLSFHLGRYAECLARSTELEGRFAVIVGAVRERVTARIYRCASLSMLGDFGALQVQRALLLEDAQLRGDHFAWVNAESGLLNLGILAQDGADSARRAADRAMRRWAKATVTVQHVFDLLAQARIDLYEGDAERAVARIDASSPALERAFLLRTPFLKACILDVRARAELMRARPQLERVARSIQRLHALQTPAFDALATTLDAGRLAHRHEHAAGLARAMRAARAFDGLGMRAHAAAARSIYEERGEIDASLGRALGLPGLLR